MLVIMNAPTMVIRDVMSSSMMSTSFMCRLRNKGLPPFSVVILFLERKRIKKNVRSRILWLPEALDNPGFSFGYCPAK